MVPLHSSNVHVLKFLTLLFHSDGSHVESSTIPLMSRRIIRVNFQRALKFSFSSRPVPLIKDEDQRLYRAALSLSLLTAGSRRGVTTL